MYSLADLGYQNKQNQWSLFFAHLSNGVLENCGRGGEGAIREAVRRVGHAQGSLQLQQHLRERVKTNLTSLCVVGCGSDSGARMRTNITHHMEDSVIWEVTACPMAKTWERAGASFVGGFFCEEYTHSLVSAYTEGKAQTNISRRLTNPRDSHCCFSVYYRLANLSDTQRERSVNSESGDLQGNRMAFPTCNNSLNLLCIQFYSHLLDIVSAAYHSEGVNAIALGLRSFCVVAAEQLLKNAEDTLRSCDREFISDNFPLCLESSQEPLWQDYSKNEAASLLQTNLLNPLKLRLGVSNR